MDIVNSTGFLITTMGTILGFLSWKGSKETNKMIQAGDARLQKSLDEGNARLQKSLEMMEYNRKDSEKAFQATLDMMERNREEGNKRLELILSNMQQRWDQSDEFNKRMLDKILDKVA